MWVFSGFFDFFWLIVWAYGINKCGWCLAGGKGWWLKGPHQIPVPKSKLNISLFFTLPHLLDCVICSRNFVSIVLLLWLMGGGGGGEGGGWGGEGVGRWGWLIYIRVWVDIYKWAVWIFINIQTLMNLICIYLQPVLDEEWNDLGDFIDQSCFVQNYLRGGGWGVVFISGGGYYVFVFLPLRLSCPISF